MKKLFCIIIVIMSLFTLCYADEPNSSIETLTESEVLTSETESTIIHDSFEEYITPIAEVTENIDTTSLENYFDVKNENSDNTGGITFTLSAKDIKRNITVIIQNIESKEEFKLEFLAQNNHTVAGRYPAGTYKIKSVDIDSEQQRIKKCSFKDGETIKIENKDYQIAEINTVIKKEAFIVGFLRREWFLLILLVVLYIAYNYKKNHRVLPSSEN